MPVRIDRYEVHRLAEEGAQLVEVLPHEEYEAVHIPGALNLPLEDIDAKAIDLLDPRRPLIVYCNDYL